MRRTNGLLIRHVPDFSEFRFESASWKVEPEQPLDSLDQVFTLKTRVEKHSMSWVQVFASKTRREQGILSNILHPKPHLLSRHAYPGRDHPAAGGWYWKRWGKHWEHWDVRWTSTLCAQPSYPMLQLFCQAESLRQINSCMIRGQHAMKLTWHRTWKWMVGILVSFLGMAYFSGLDFFKDTLLIN